MPRSRGSELPQRSPKLGDRRVTSQRRTTNSDPDPLHHRPIADRNSPKLGDGRSPRGSHSDPPVNQKKLGTRIAGLESQLEQAQEELKILKDQLASAEAAKKQAQQELEKKAATKAVIPEAEELLEKRSPPIEKTQEFSQKNSHAPENADDHQQETDVFEVPMEKLTVEEPEIEEISQPTDENEVQAKLVTILPEPEKPYVDELALKNNEICSLKVKLEEKEKELDGVSQENGTLKNQLIEKTSAIMSARVKEDEMKVKLNKLGEELETSKSKIVELNEKLGAVEGAKEALETEMKKLRVQTEQWRKAADAAAAVLAGGVEINGRRISERCGSMDKHYGGVFEQPIGGYGFVGSPGLGDDSDDGFGNGKRKGSGIRMFGDLWKKKSQK